MGRRETNLAHRQDPGHWVRMLRTMRVRSRIIANSVPRITSLSWPVTWKAGAVMVATWALQRESCSRSGDRDGRQAFLDL
jgi:hypothetical protein